MLNSDHKIVSITGASGLLGLHLCDYFHEAGWLVRGMVRNMSKYPFKNKGIPLFHCNLPDEIDTKALDKADILIHCAYETRHAKLEKAKQVNENGAKRLLQLSRNASVGQFVFVSSNSAHPNAHSYYARSKYFIECALDPNRDLVIRPGMILANDGGLFFRIARHVKYMPFVPVFSGGERKIQTVHIDDLCKSFLWAIENRLHGIITVAEPDGVTFEELIRLLIARFHYRKIIIPLPANPVLIILRFFEYLGFKLPFSSENLQGLIGLQKNTPSIRADQLGLSLRKTEESISNIVPFFKM